MIPNISAKFLLIYVVASKSLDVINIGFLYGRL